MDRDGVFRMGIPWGTEQRVWKIRIRLIMKRANKPEKSPVCGMRIAKGVER